MSDDYDDIDWDAKCAIHGEAMVFGCGVMFCVQCKVNEMKSQ